MGEEKDALGSENDNFLRQNLNAISLLGHVFWDGESTPSTNRVYNISKKMGGKQSSLVSICHNSFSQHLFSFPENCIHACLYVVCTDVNMLGMISSLGMASSPVVPGYMFLSSCWGTLNFMQQSSMFGVNINATYNDIYTKSF